MTMLSAAWLAALACSQPVQAADNPSSAQPAARAKHYPAPTFLVGEYRDWQETATTLAGSVTAATWHEPVSAIAFDGTMNLQIINASSGALQENDLLDPVGNKLLRTSANATFCSYSPADVVVAYPLYVGQTFMTQSRYRCGAGYREDVLNNVSVEATEQVTVPGGSFSTLRIHSHADITNSNDANLVNGSIGQAQYATDYICWWSPQIGRAVKCQTTWTYDGAAPTTYKASDVFEMTTFQAGTTAGRVN